MKKIILDLTVSLDGFIEGNNKEIDWIVFDDELAETLYRFADEIDTVLYGRVSYEAYGNYVPADDASQFEKDFYAQIHTKRKYVFSRQTLPLTGNYTLIQDNIVNEVRKIKESSEKDIWLFGGAGLISTFLNHDLIDEMRITVNPVVIGGGIPLFKEINNRKNLRLINTRTYRCGVVGLYYEPIRDVIQ
ncbi:putative protein YyaP [Mycovorax composti]|uniref:Bacterial bifunctional deaminase-reductase C-terminal domain-containing protein n=1 Tax=Mycovorax composti TaxID=2962693 RepID=A0ABZ2ELG6_9BACT